MQDEPDPLLKALRHALELRQQQPAGDPLDHPVYNDEVNAAVQVVVRTYLDRALGREAHDKGGQ